MVNLHNKILPVALVAALLGGSVGALVMRKGDQPETRVASANLLPAAQPANTSRADALRFNDTVAANNAQDTVAVNNSDANGVNFQNSAEETAYREGFADGFEAGRNERASTVTRTAAPSRVVYRNNAPARRVRSSRASRTAYYDYQQPRKRSFWQKHRDKLTVAMGAGGGALIGGLVGGKKGALIGAGAGGGGAALYTYGLRKRNRRN
jgi:hypothetical protein